MDLTRNKRLCFVISPIGDDGTETRRRADQVFKHVIEPAAQECDYQAIRADQISKPGIITSQIIKHLAEDPLVIADLAGHNPNVFYELAIRHVARKPVIQITEVGEAIPFDVAPTRAIQLDHKDLESASLCKQNLVKQIRSVESNTTDFDNPISNAIDLQLLQRSNSPLEKGNARVISMLENLTSMVIELTTTRTKAERGKLQPYPPGGKFMQTLEDHDYRELERFAKGRGITVQELIRAVVIPEWTEEIDNKMASNDLQRRTPALKRSS